MKVSIYTVGYRRIMETQCGAANTKEVTVSIPSTRIRNLGSGTYYLIVTGKSGNKDTAVSKPVELIILR